MIFHRLFTILLVLLLNTCLQAQQTLDSTAIKFSRFINSEDLSRHLSVLASDEYEGRETGKAGQKKAAEYIATQFKSYGIIPVVNGNSYYQVFHVLEQDPQGKISLNNKDYGFLHDFYYFPGFSDTLIKAEEFLFLGYGIDDAAYSDYKGTDVKNKILVVLDKEPGDKRGRSLITGKKEFSDWSADPRKKSQIAKQKGAAALLIVKKDFALHMEYNRHYIEQPTMMLELDTNDRDYRASKKRLHTFFISEKMAAEIVGEKTLKETILQISKTRKTVVKRIPAELVIDVERDTRRLATENVIAYIEGTDLKDEHIIITAHYDHIGKEGDKVFNGADDDGSGTVAIMEIAEAFQKAAESGFRPRRSIIIMPVSGEEKGLLGSFFYSEYPLFPLNKTVANLNIDMIGRMDKQHEGNPDYVYLIGSDILSMDLHNISENANALYCKLQLDYTYNDLKDANRFYYRSDHYNFARKNIPVIFYFNGVHDDYHQHTDDVEKIDFKKIEKIARLVFFTAWDLANRNDRPALNGKGAR